MMIDPTEPSGSHLNKTLRELGLDTAHKELFVVGADMKASDKVLQETIMNIPADAETKFALRDMHNLDAAKAILTAQLVDDHHELVSKMQSAEGDQTRPTQAQREEIIRLHQDYEEKRSQMYYVYQERMRRRARGTRYYRQTPTDMAVHDWLRWGRDLSEYSAREEFSEDGSLYGTIEHEWMQQQIDALLDEE